ncbi:MAG: hypothetical protein E7559_09420 [Ruminococcaceae bacterium]|nr:hypothetical protein [Oscillospiraceae bacterium]
MNIVLDFSGISSRKELHAYIKEAFRFPEYYGSNLDALHDCLSEISEPTEVTIYGKQALLDTFDQYGDTLLQVMRSTAHENPHFSIEIMD